MNPTTDPGYDDLFMELVQVDGELRRIRGAGSVWGRFRTLSRRARNQPEPPMSEAATAREVVGVDDAKEQIVARGRERGFVTSEDLLEAVPVDDFTPEQVEEFLTRSRSISRARASRSSRSPARTPRAATQVRSEDDLLRAPTNDPVRMYLKEIGKVPLLNAAAGGRPGPADRGGGVLHRLFRRSRGRRQGRPKKL